MLIILEPIFNVYNWQIFRLFKIYQILYFISIDLTNTYHEKKTCEGNNLKITF